MEVEEVLVDHAFLALVVDIFFFFFDNLQAVLKKKRIYRYTIFFFNWKKKKVLKRLTKSPQGLPLFSI